VLEALDRFTASDNSNVHRGIHELSRRSTEAFEAARDGVAASSTPARSDEIIFTRGTTEAINLVARAWGDKNIKSGDTILLTEMEHHSNIVPWQLLAERTGAKLAYVPVTGDDGLLDLRGLDNLLDATVKLFAFTFVSNTLGTVNPVADLCARARRRGIVTLVDAAQSRRPPSSRRGRRSAAISWPFPATNSAARPAAASSTAGARCLADMPPFLGGGDMIAQG
jgi:cysteine desulfurase/selenocysteine lyase